MDALVSKMKKNSSDQLIKKIQKGELNAAEKKAALEVLEIRGVKYAAVVTEVADEKAVAEVNKTVGVEKVEKKAKAEKKVSEPKKERETPTTKTIEKFDGCDDIEVGSTVKFHESRSDKTVVKGKVKRIFEFKDMINGKIRQEARIEGANGKRYFKTLAALILPKAPAEA